MKSLAYVFSTGSSIDWHFLLLLVPALEFGDDHLVHFYSSFDDVDYIQQFQFITNSVSPFSIFCRGAGNVSCAVHTSILSPYHFSFAHLNSPSSIKPGYLQIKMLFKKLNSDKVEIHMQLRTHCKRNVNLTDHQICKKSPNYFPLLNSP